LNFMANLTGEITLTKRLLDNPIWERPEYGYCWIDLLLRANDDNRRVPLNGTFFDVKRGQLIRSKRTLMESWKKSDKWVDSFLEFCQDEGMLQVDSNHRRTIITILNYTIYNPKKTPKSVSDSGADSSTELVSDSGADSRRNREMGIGNEKWERATTPEKPENSGFAEVPADAEVLAVAAAYPGDLARGIPAVIRPEWAIDWLRYKVSSNRFEKKWREKMAADWARDWVNGHPKARGPKKPGVQTDGRSAAQARFELSRELEDVQARLDACHENSVEPRAADEAREKILKRELNALAGNAPAEPSRNEDARKIK
jgi:hypothetical protein